MAVSLTSLLTSLKSGLQNNSGSIRNTTIALLIFGLNAVVQSEDFFQCPPDNFTFYACSSFISGVAISSQRILEFCSRVLLLKEPEKQGLKRSCCCLYLRWRFTKSLIEIIFQSSLAGFLWIIWILLQRDYYICAALGGTKEAKLINTSTEESLQIEADYANAGKTSQAAALLLLGGALATAFVVLSVQRCCLESEIGSLPGPYQYQKLECEAAIDTFNENMEKLAKGEGKRRADFYFATTSKTNPSDVLKSAYQNLIKVNKFEDAFPSLEDYQHLQAQAAVTAFKERVQQEGKQKVELTFVDLTWREDEEKYPFSLVCNAYEGMTERYPRSTGDRTKPYIKEREDKKDASPNKALELITNPGTGDDLNVS